MQHYVIGGLPGNGRFDDDPKMRALFFDDEGRHGGRRTGTHRRSTG